MNFLQNLFMGKPKQLFAWMVLSLVFATMVAFSISDNDDFDTARREVLLRRIGHEILLQAGDSTSRVLPVKKISENEYQISFENELTFQTDSLVITTQRLLKNDPLGSGYVVNVLNCDSSTVAYGYAISNNKKNDIVACLGREQPIACYRINVKFESNKIATTRSKYFLGSLSVLAFAGFIVLGRRQPRKVIPNTQGNKTYALGSIVFDPQKRQMLSADKTIELTGTETRLLLIFASSPNETIERSRLQKEIWEDAGVIVGRSLDMFISKLRKKLAIDPKINIAVIRGKGYMLEVSA
jgi:DNA-binding winged helix-turn-helix (wHTH) protein